TYRPIFNVFLEDSQPDKWMQSGIVEKDELQLTNNPGHQTVSYQISTGNGGSFKQAIIKPGTNSEPVYSYTDKKLPAGLYWKFVGLVFLLILYVTMVYGPIAAFLVELFPTKIRYTSMSLPYHIGNGVFGGLVPFIGVLLTTT